MNISPIAKSARPCRQNILRLGGNAGYTPERREAKMIFGGLAKSGIADAPEADTHKMRKDHLRP